MGRKGLGSIRWIHETPLRKPQKKIRGRTSNTLWQQWGREEEGGCRIDTMLDCKQSAASRLPIKVDQGSWEGSTCGVQTTKIVGRSTIIYQGKEGWEKKERRRLVKDKKKYFFGQLKKVAAILPRQKRRNLRGDRDGES